MSASPSKSWLGSTQRELSPLALAIAALIFLAGLLITFAMAQRTANQAEAGRAAEFATEAERASADLAKLIQDEVDEFEQSLLYVEATYRDDEAQFVRYFDGLGALSSGDSSPYVFVELVDQKELAEARLREQAANSDEELNPVAVSKEKSVVVIRRSSNAPEGAEYTSGLLSGLSGASEGLSSRVTYVDLAGPAESASGNNQPAGLLVGTVEQSEGATIGYLVKDTSFEAAIAGFQYDQAKPLNVSLRNVTVDSEFFRHRGGLAVSFEDAQLSSSNDFAIADTSWKVAVWTSEPNENFLLTFQSAWSIFGSLCMALAWLTWSSRDRRTVDAGRQVLLAQELAYTDRLTGLLNRGGLFEKCRDLGSVSATLFFIDLNHFKAVNDNFGHEMGDRVLVAVAETLQETTRPIDMVARVGGDEFVIVMPGMTDRRRAVRLARGIERSIAGMKSGVTASVGVSCSDSQQQLDLTLLIRQADEEMYERKQIYHDHVEVQPSMEMLANLGPG